MTHQPPNWRARIFGRSVRPTAEEKRRRLPGDTLIAKPIASLTHAITIDRPRRVVWPWLAQMGAGSRAGWYSYDFLDNSGRPSATEIIPQLQLLTTGMTFPALPGIVEGFTLLAYEPERFLILGWSGTDCLLTTWVFVLEECGPTSTRLIVRARGGPDYRFLGLRGRTSRPLIRLVHFIMERRQLHGIAARAETAFEHAVGQVPVARDAA